MTTDTKTTTFQHCAQCKDKVAHEHCEKLGHCYLGPVAPSPQEQAPSAPYDPYPDDDPLFGTWENARTPTGEPAWRPEDQEKLAKALPQPDMKALAPEE